MDEGGLAMNMKTWILLCAVIISGLTLTALSVYAVIMEVPILLGAIMVLTTTITAFMLFYHLWTTKTQKEKRDNKLIWILILAVIMGFLASVTNLFLSR